MATYYYCDNGVSTPVTVTLNIGSEVQYYAQYVGDCYVTKKRRLLTVSIPSAIPVRLTTTTTYTRTYRCFPDPAETELGIQRIIILAGQTSASAYIDTYIHTSCPYDSGDIRYELPSYDTDYPEMR